MTRPALVCLLALALAACADPAPGGAEDPSDFASVDVPPVEVVDASTLAAWLPDAVDGRPRAALTDASDAALGAEVARAAAPYGAGPDVIVSVSDLGSADMVEMMGFGWGLAGRAETLVGGHPAQSEGGLAGRPYEERVLVAERFLVEAESDDPDLAAAAVRAVDLDGLAGAGR